MNGLKYKVGDKVLVKSKEWYLANRDNGLSKWVSFSDGSVFGLAKSTYCGQIMTIEEISEDGEYILKEDNSGMHWSEECFEKRVDITPVKMVSVEKIEEWLYENFCEYERDYDYGTYMVMESNFDSVDEMIDSFHKLVEEENE